MRQSPELLRKLLGYDPETGLLWWRVRTPDMFGSSNTSHRTCKTFNTRYSGKEAFNTDNGDGYRQGTALGIKQFAHRVAWAIHYGEWPDGQIDHQNGNKSDNRIENIRDVSHHENGRNQKISIANTSGFTGVYWHKRGQRWCARIRHLDRNVNLGTFSRKGDAIAARKEAEVKYGYHANHGRTQ